MAEFNHRKKEQLAQEAKARKNKHNLSYVIRTVIAIGMLGLLGYYIYQKGSPGDNNEVKVTPVKVQAQKRANKLEME